MKILNRKRLISIVRSFFRVYLLFAVALYIFQRSVMYHPSHFDVPPRGNASFSPWLSSHQEFLGYVRNEPAATRVVILFHGNGGEALNRSWLATLIPNPDSLLVLAELPGYGAKDGEPNETAFVAAAHRIVKESVERWHLPIQIIGESIGTGVACAVANDTGVTSLALLSPFDSALSLAQTRLPFLPMTVLMKDTYRSDQRLAAATLPLFVVHGTDDEVIPFTSGQALFGGYPGPHKWFLAVPGGHHNDLLPYLLHAPEAGGLRDFLQGRS